MTQSHPYISGPKNIALMLSQLRKNFPATVSSDTVKRLGIAPKNESYVINVLNFLELIDPEGKATETARSVFSISKDETFNNKFSEIVKNAYNDLFDLYGDAAWELDSQSLLDFFRQADQTSEAIGKRQVGVFNILLGFSGKGELPDISKNPTPKKSTPKTAAKKTMQNNVNKKPAPTPSGNVGTDVNITVRVEVNLPNDGTAETYDNIFASIRKNLIDG